MCVWNLSTNYWDLVVFSMNPLIGNSQRIWKIKQIFFLALFLAVRWIVRWTCSASAGCAVRWENVVLMPAAHRWALTTGLILWSFLCTTGHFWDWVKAWLKILLLPASAATKALVCVTVMLSVKCVLRCGIWLSVSVFCWCGHFIWKQEQHFLEASQ